jgi:hypothetical protein
MPALVRIKPGGVAEYFEPLGVTTVHCSTCAHCQRQTEFPSMRRIHEHVDVCRGCMKLICLECAGKPCRPYEKELERQEAEFRLQRRIESGGWGCY